MYRAQSALEYMMTYGWAILIIVIVAVILYSMGIFNPASSITTTSTGFSPFTVSTTICTDGGLKFLLSVGPLPNSAQFTSFKEVYIISASGTNFSGVMLKSNYSLPFNAVSGGTYSIVVPGISCNSAGTKFTIKTVINYVEHTSAGIVSFNSSGVLAGNAAKVNINNIYVSDSGSDLISIISPNNIVIGNFSVAACANGIAFLPGTYNLYIADPCGNEVSIYNAFTGQVIQNIKGWMNVPIGVAITPNKEYAYVANLDSNNITVINISDGNKEIKNITVGNFPRNSLNGDVITPNGAYVYATVEGANHTSVISTATNTVIKNISMEHPNTAVISPNGDYVYITANKYVYNVSTKTNSIVGEISAGLQLPSATNSPYGFPLYGITVSPNGNYLYVANQSGNNTLVISAATHSVIKIIKTLGGPSNLLYDPNNNNVYIIRNLNGLNNVQVMSAITNSIIANITVGLTPYGIGMVG